MRAGASLSGAGPTAGRRRRGVCAALPHVDTEGCAVSIQVLPVITTEATEETASVCPGRDKPADPEL